MAYRRIAVAAATAAATAAGLAVAGLAVAPAAVGAEGKPVVVNCLGKGEVKPKEIVFACADAGIMIDKIRWTSWTQNGAKGRGTLVWNTCLPTDCASGIVQTYRVRITLGGLASGPDADVFSQVDLRFPNLGPAALETGSYTINNPLR